MTRDKAYYLTPEKALAMDIIDELPADQEPP